MPVDESRQLFTRRSLAVAAGMLLVFVVILHLEGRIAWGKTGFGLWSDAWTHTTSQHLADPYTLSHFLHGVIFYWALRWLKWPLPWRLIAALTLELGWEVLENSPPIIERYRSQTASLDYTGDTILNSLGDALAAMAGFAFAARYAWQAAVVAFGVLELAALYLARDNLTLNVLMLAFPLEAVVDWQLAR
ncbi:MAG: DUF2585 family protein [Pirellulales bacterium]